MPDWKTHEKICELILGKKYSEVHRLMDLLYPLKNHRKLWGHNIRDMIIISLLQKNPLEAFIAAYLHKLADDIFPKDKLKRLILEKIILKL